LEDDEFERKEHMNRTVYKTVGGNTSKSFEQWMGTCGVREQK
jgi:hypothetical protein